MVQLDLQYFDTGYRMEDIKVYEQYDKIVGWFDEHRNKELMEKRYFDFIITHIPYGGTVLDLGCGTGEPIAAYFIKNGYALTGVDGSTKMIELCKTRFSEQNWIVDDLLHINLYKQFDLILAWHSFFHLTHDQQLEAFTVINTHLKPGGLFAFTSGHQHGEVWSDNGGQNLYHASLSTAAYREQLDLNNFKVLIHEIEDPKCGDATIWITQKNKSI